VCHHIASAQEVHDQVGLDKNQVVPGLLVVGSTRYSLAGGQSAGGTCLQKLLGGGGGPGRVAGAGRSKGHRGAQGKLGSAWGLSLEAARAPFRMGFLSTHGESPNQIRCSCTGRSSVGRKRGGVPDPSFSSASSCPVERFLSK